MLYFTNLLINYNLLRKLLFSLIPYFRITHQSLLSDNKRLIKVNASKSRRPHLMQYEPIFWGKNPLENFFDLGGFFRCTKCQRFLINHQGPHTGIKGTFFRRNSHIFKQFSNVRKDEEDNRKISFIIFQDVADDEGQEDRKIVS